jgi:multiple sugar transport system ATP-binding protein
VYDDPADTFVATFIGPPPMNLVSRDGVLVGFRPEHLLPTEVVGADAVRIPFAVERIEYLSGDRHVYGTVTGIGEETRVIARLPSTVSTPLSADEVHDFAVPRDRLRFFDAQTQLRRKPVPLGS